MAKEKDKNMDEAHNMIKSCELSGHKEIVKVFKAYVKSKGWQIGHEVGKSLGMYMDRRMKLDKMEQDMDSADK